jgi:hypothetical protein
MNGNNALRGRDIALRCPRPRSSGRNALTDVRARENSFRRLTLRSATGTAQRAIPTDSGAVNERERGPLCQWLVGSAIPGIVAVGARLGHVYFKLAKVAETVHLRANQ